MAKTELSLRHLTSPDFGKIPDVANERIRALARPHIESFDFFLGDGMRKMIEDFQMVKFHTSTGDKIQLRLKDFQVASPEISSSERDTFGVKLFPKECIERKCTYSGKVTATVGFAINKNFETETSMNLGEIPIMLMSQACHLRGMTPKELVKHGELANETGGYFIINGTLRLMRLLIANRRNYPLTIERDSWKKRCVENTGKGVMIRCVNEHERSLLNVVHHLTTGGVNVELRVKRHYFYFPLIYCLCILDDRTHLSIFKAIMNGRKHDQYMAENIKAMMRKMVKRGFTSQQELKKYIGNAHRLRLENCITEDTTDEEVCDILLKNYLFIHLKTNEEKFHLLCHMTRKLYAYVSGECLAENPDVVSLQESHLGGYTFLQIVRSKVTSIFHSVKYYMESAIRNNQIVSDDLIRKAVSGKSGFGKSICSIIATGNVPSNCETGLTQSTGLTIVVDHLNRLRDLSHFRAIHRGTFFVELQTLEPRRLTGDAWGFICPIHTPDGQICGLLNHLTESCVLTPPMLGQSEHISKILIQYGVMSVQAIDPTRFYDPRPYLDVMLDGKLVGYILLRNAKELVYSLRKLKIEEVIPKYTEIALLEPRKFGGQNPGVYLFTSSSRMMRPVYNVRFKDTEYVGSFEQLYLNIATSRETFDQDIHEYYELEKTSILSNVAKLIPFADCSPSPRNIYQCQMAKQTMGTPVHNYGTQTSHKIYRLNYPQVPLVRNSHYDDMNMEEFCLGFNAVVAVVSYSGFDMEDAIVINKQSMERGLGHGSIYKTVVVDLSEKEASQKSMTYMFKRDDTKPHLSDFLDSNGLPMPGTRLKEGDPFYCTYHESSNRYTLKVYTGEPCVVDKYSIMPTTSQQTFFQKVIITITVKRNPIVGDKFASRCGQKGILSYLCPVEELPFSERGIVPDILFNPHSIPSRMTAAKLIEVVAGKSAAEYGKSYDSTPFNYDDDNPAYDYFGRILERAGFNYYGEDILYSGIDGRMLECSIFEGVVYYQRLRHMVSDKWQVRTTGKVDSFTQQPVKGRSRGGAIRFGEMERDCLISHGASFLIKDRMLDCSDSSTEFVCSNCGCTLSPNVIAKKRGREEITPRMMYCRTCGPDAKIRQITIPFALKCLTAELAAVGIRLQAFTDS